MESASKRDLAGRLIVPKDEIMYEMTSSLEAAGSVSTIEDIVILISNGAVYFKCGNDKGGSALASAVNFGNYDIVSTLIKSGVELNFVTKEGKTALIIAVEQDYDEIAMLLINGGADVNISDKKGKTALMYCKSDKIAFELIKRDADINITDEEGETALVKAVYRGYQNVAQVLIKNGADVNIADKKGNTPLFYSRNESIMMQLIHRGAVVELTNNRNETELMKSLYLRNDQVALRLIEVGVDVNAVDKEGRTALMIALALGNIDLAQTLIDKGADFNIADKQGKTAVQYCKNEKITLELIEKGADIEITNNQFEPELIKSLYHGNDQMAFTLIKRGCDVNAVDKQGKSALIVACELGNIVIAQALINEAAYINKADKEEKTALIKAIERGYDQITLALINGGADVNTCNTEGQTALMKAIFFRNDKIAISLLNACARVNQVDKQGKTALMYCTDKTVTLELINKGADITITDKAGDTALMKAVRRGNQGVVEALIKNGADVNVFDKQGKTPLMCCKDEEIAFQLISLSVDVSMTDHEGNTALMHAVLNGNTASGCELIKHQKTLVNKRNGIGRTPLFYALTKRNESAQYLLDNGANLLITDNYNVSTLSYFIYYCINNRPPHSQMQRVFALFREKGVEEHTIAQAISSAVLCKIPLHISCTKTNVCQVLSFVLDLNVEGKETIRTILTELEKSKMTICRLPDIFLMMTNFGADQNVADEKGNTASHYVINALLRISYKTAVDICDKLESDAGLVFNKKNLNEETPLFFLLFNALKLVESIGYIPNLSQLASMCKFLIKVDTSSINGTLKSGQTVFHLVLLLFQKGLHLQDKKYQSIFLQEMEKLLKIFSPPKIVKEVTVNKVEENSNSPLHLWASLSFSSVQMYSKISFTTILDSIFKHLLKCGAMINARNQKGETPLHLCKTWSSVKLLVGAGANVNDLDIEMKTPLLTAAQNQYFLLKPDYFYPDVTEDASSFWKYLNKIGFDLWSSDKDGDSLISQLIKSEAFVLAKALVEVACRTQKSDIIVGVLNAICKDRSSRLSWKAILVEMIIKSTRGRFDLNTSLHLCCINIKDHFSAVGYPKGYAESVSTEEMQPEINSVTGGSVHWQIAKLLLCYGASRKCCLELAEGCPTLRNLLTKPLAIDELPVITPWTSYSQIYVNKLAEVARRKNCESIGTYWYHIEWIGNGRFGRVFAGINEKDGREVAIKRIEKERISRAEDIREIQTYSSLTDCKQIVHYLGFEQCEHFSFVILELMEGNLEEYFESDFYNPLKKSVLCKDIAMGLLYLHDQNIIHRDLKPNNILYKTHPKLCLKIADFGLSRRLDIGSSISTVMTNDVGTRGWIAPEVLLSSVNDYSLASDIFSCGLLFHYIFSPQQHPFNPVIYTKKTVWQINNERENNMINYKLEGWDGFLLPDVSDIVLRMLAKDMKKRPTAHDLIDHPMFWSDRRKVDFLKAVGNQPEIECPRNQRSILTAFEKELEAKFSSIVKFGKWDDPRYINMPTIYAENTQPIVKTDKNGKIITRKNRKYDRTSVVELIRFIRNANDHASDTNRSSIFRRLVLFDFVFLDYFPNLVLEVYKAVRKHGWDARDEIKREIVP